MNTEKSRVVVIDHYDSFTYNLVVAFENLGATVEVFRTNTAIGEIAKAKPTHIVLSPGPGHPKDVLLFREALKWGMARIPMLGVCLGHQALGLDSGDEVVRSPIVMHGKISEVSHNNRGIFAGIPNPFRACRYHSLAIAQSTGASALTVTATSSDRVIMGVEVKEYPHVVGVQFHPESLFTEHGAKLLQNFLALKVPEPSATLRSALTVPAGFGQIPRSPTRGTKGWG